MQALTDRSLLDIWERGQGRGPVERALLLLAAAFPDLGEDAGAGLSIGERDTATPPTANIGTQHRKPSGSQHL